MFTYLRTAMGKRYEPVPESGRGRCLLVVDCQSLIHVNLISVSFVIHVCSPTFSFEWNKVVLDSTRLALTFPCLGSRPFSSKAVVMDTVSVVGLAPLTIKEGLKTAHGVSYPKLWLWTLSQL